MEVLFPGTGCFLVEDLYLFISTKLLLLLIHRTDYSLKPDVERV